MADGDPVSGKATGAPATVTGNAADSVNAAGDPDAALSDPARRGEDAATPAVRKLPVSPQIGPYVVHVKEGQSYLWCSCGLSRTQPYCDGSHEGTGLSPVAFEAMFDAEFHLCGCKQSDNKPYCFGNCRGHHRRLKTS